MTPSESRPQLEQLKADAESQGFVFGLDFYVWGIPGMLGSEVVVFGLDGADYTVSYKDMGEKREIARTADFAQARTTFLEEVARLAGPRGRGPYAGQPAKTGYEGMSRRETFAQMQREGLFAGMTFEDVYGADEE